MEWFENENIIMHIMLLCRQGKVWNNQQLFLEINQSPFKASQLPGQLFSMQTIGIL